MLEEDKDVTNLTPEENQERLVKSIDDSYKISAKVSILLDTLGVLKTTNNITRILMYTILALEAASQIAGDNPEDAKEIVIKLLEGFTLEKVELAS